MEVTWGLELVAHVVPHEPRWQSQACRLCRAGDTVALWLTEPLEQNLYSVYLRLFDRQGKDQVTVIRAQVCDCQGRVESCAQKPRVDTGVPIVLAVLGAVLALLREYPSAWERGGG